MRRLIFRIEKLHTISNLKDDSWTEEGFWENIHYWISQNYEVVAGHIGWAIKSSYKRCLSAE